MAGTLLLRKLKRQLLVNDTSLCRKSWRSMDWKLEISPKAQKQLDKMDGSVQKRILGFLYLRLPKQPSPWTLAEPLTGEFAGLVRYRVGDHRVVSEIVEDRLLIHVIRMAHRSEVYELRIDRHELLAGEKPESPGKKK